MYDHLVRISLGPVFDIYNYKVCDADVQRISRTLVARLDFLFTVRLKRLFAEHTKNEKKKKCDATCERKYSHNVMETLAPSQSLRGHEIGPCALVHIDNGVCGWRARRLPFATVIKRHAARSLARMLSMQCAKFEICIHEKHVG